MMSVKFLKFLNKGKGVMGRSLEPVFVLGFWVIPVELQFSIDPATYDRYRNLRPVNWSYTDAIWFKSGNPLSSLWQLHSNSKGIGPDGPDPGNALIDGATQGKLRSDPIALVRSEPEITARLFRQGQAKCGRCQITTS